MKTIAGLVAYMVFSVAHAGGVVADGPAEIPADRLSVFLVPKAGEKDFFVARSPEEFTKMLQLHAPPVQPFKARPPPVVDFGARMVVAYFWEDFPCQPYRIGRVLQYPDRVTVEIIHKVMGNCLCVASSMAAAAAVTIPRVSKPIDYIVIPEAVISCSQSRVP